uniref:Putative conserved secreted protein n=2 Tax=Haematobia irritans TaxID=7368 RepID=A0A1L8EC13_HAEIR
MIFHMKSLWHVFGLAFVVCGFIVSINGDCGVCRADTNTACISKTEYKPCYENKPFGDYVFNCEAGFCSMVGEVCTPTEAFSECNECNKCDSTKTFACTGTKEFDLCLGRNEPSGIKGQCNDGLGCNINNPYICGEEAPTCSFRDDPTTTTVAPTTPAPTTTTPSPLENPTGFCSLMKQEGRYPVGTDANTTCHQYINCVNVNGEWYGPIYVCPGKTYYDSAERVCVKDLPPLCDGKVKHLAFHSLLLE